MAGEPFTTFASRGVPGAWPEKTIMPSHLKKRVRARMAKTGESFQQARRRVSAKRPRPGRAGEGVALDAASDAGPASDGSFRGGSSARRATRLTSTRATG